MFAAGSGRVSWSHAMEWITTSTILHDLRDYGNRAAWSRFVERFRSPIVRFAGSMGLSAIDAEDVAQETLLAFAEGYRRGEYDPTRGRLSRWLFGIAFRQGMKGRRIESRQPAGTPGAALSWSQVPDEASATVSWDQEWEQTLLEQCLTQVRQEVEPVTFQAFELAVRLDRPPADVARELGAPIKLVYNAKHRVLNRVRELRAEFEEAA